MSTHEKQDYLDLIGNMISQHKEREGSKMTSGFWLRQGVVPFVKPESSRKESDL